MEDKISLFNVYSFIYLWNTSYGKKYITNLINNIISANDSYELNPFINDNCSNLRSYLVFESKMRYILVDFNYFTGFSNLSSSKDIISFNRYLNDKENILILFNNYYGNSFYYSNNSIKIYNLYSNKVSKNRKIVNLLKKMDKEYIDRYKNELIIHKRINNKK